MKNENTPMAVGIDARPLFFTRGGIVRYLLGLLNALPATRPDIQVLPYGPKPFSKQLGIPPHPKLMPQVIRFPLRWPILERIWENCLLPLASMRQAQLLHFPRFAVPRFRILPTVVTIHDLTFRRYPETMKADARDFFDSATARAVHRANHIITVSHSTYHDLMDTYQISPDRVHIVHNGIDGQFSPTPNPDENTVLKRQYDLEAGYLLYVGTLEPRKNVHGILKAYAQLLQTPPSPPQLVMAGGKGWLYESIFDAIDNLNLRQYIRFLGHVPEIDLPMLYRNASVFVFPSFYEGFGFPILEAMACGVPVVTANTSSLPEVGGDAVLYADPHDPEAIADGLRQVLVDRDLAASLQKKGLLQAAKFPWSLTAQRTQDVYRTCLFGLPSQAGIEPV